MIFRRPFGANLNTTFLEGGFFIEKNTDIEYHIRFQNTGTDTAFFVKITDQLSNHLDPTSIRPGASSHPYTFELSGEGLVKFKFFNILLPDSTTNETASNGFVKFRISQKPNLPNGIVINNEANIYFDFNEAVITNQTMHTVGENFITVSSPEIIFPNLQVDIFPNPFNTSATLKIQGNHFDNLSLQIYNISGKLVQEQHALYNQITIDRTDLISGMYFYRLEGDGELIGSGKIVVE